MVSRDGVLHPAHDYCVACVEETALWADVVAGVVSDEDVYQRVDGGFNYYGVVGWGYGENERECKWKFGYELCS